jgi:crossover junction endodeoxyribonuclease RuvC
MKLIAIDPGVEKIGYSIFDKINNSTLNSTFIASGLIKTDKKTEHHIRLQEIYDHLKTLIELYKPELMVVEQLFFFKNAKTVIKVAQAQGVVFLLAAQYNISLKLLTPLQIKQFITGYGNADKKAVHKMLELHLKEKLNVLDDDQSDAIACGLAYCFLNESLL